MNRMNPENKNRMSTEKTSRISGFYRLSINERMEKVREFTNLGDDEMRILQEEGIPLEQADRMIENVIGRIQVPLGIATNFLINGKDYLIPMATEEPSVVAAASNAAKMAREGGGFKASSDEPIMIGQIQLLVENPEGAKEKILANKEKILFLANGQDPVLIGLGGGARYLEIRVLGNGMVIIHLLVDVRDAMGANVVNTMCESIAPLIEEITGGKVHLRILSNLAMKRLVRVEVKIPADDLGGPGVVDAIILAYEFAASDPYRAVTHNKGAMNGITAVALATGNDTRAIEAGIHAYASISGEYKPISHWSKNKEGNLTGRIEIPLAVGTFGGATMNPIARATLKILGVKTAQELAEVMASVGLAQNLAALKALSTEGIQRGHMSLHARNIAAMAGAEGEKIDRITEILVKENNIKVDRAKELLEEEK